jgi:hypothetical protein
VIEPAAALGPDCEIGPNFVLQNREYPRQETVNFWLWRIAHAK